MPEIQADVPRNHDQGVCCQRQVSERRKVCMKSGLRCLKSRQMCTEIMARVLQNRGVTINDSMPIIWVSMPENQVNVLEIKIRLFVIVIVHSYH